MKSDILLDILKNEQKLSREDLHKICLYFARNYNILPRKINKGKVCSTIIQTFKEFNIEWLPHILDDLDQ
jgi:uncharacterized Zn finger protein